MKPARRRIVIEREEVAPRMSGPFYGSWRWLYKVEGVKRPTHSLKQAKKIAQRHAEKTFPGESFRVVLAWRESA